MAKKKPDGYKVLAANKSARHDYYIEETYEAGIVLTGTEIKSLRGGRASLRESFARIEGDEIFLLGMNISPYEQGNINNVDPLRPRKLLLHKKEIIRLTALAFQDGLTLVPLRIYLNAKGRAKVEIAVAKGKKNYDKREAIAKRDTERRIRQLTGSKK
ncbi:MAG: SsrA-binding protein SmpB [Clostridiales Family XIII bacterium]|jgi:SsrA-binding protein|nr:SsrA-binding protein SmpB [Clostridiales Family XIII bacterium]